MLRHRASVAGSRSLFQICRRQVCYCVTVASPVSPQLRGQVGQGAQPEVTAKPSFTVTLLARGKNRLGFPVFQHLWNHVGDRQGTGRTVLPAQSPKQKGSASLCPGAWQGWGHWYPKGPSQRGGQCLSPAPGGQALGEASIFEGQGAARAQVQAWMRACCEACPAKPPDLPCSTWKGLGPRTRV